LRNGRKTFVRPAKAVLSLPGGEECLMKIGIISNDHKCYSTVRLVQAARERGHSVRVFKSWEFSIFVEQSRPALYIAGKPLPRLDAVIPRLSAAHRMFGTAVIRQFEQMGTFCLNASHAVSVAHDKLRTMQVLSRHRIGIPPSAFVFNRADIVPAIQKLGGAPIIIKLLQGAKGEGVILADNANAAQAMLEALQAAGENVLLQHFIEESRGQDIRAFVIGDRVVAAMRRKARKGEFRSNLHLGASVRGIRLSAEYENTAIRAAQILGLRIAGVDLVKTAKGPKVLEVNSSPGLEGIEAASGVDIAAAMMKYLESQVQFPDVDLRERLSLAKGYGVAEFKVAKNSALARQRVAEAQLEERGLQLLSIDRNGLVIPNPPASEYILPGDVLLCFGKQLELKALIPRGSQRGSKRRARPRTARRKT
jgi:ribosomal protein S6--L-glutamate ligase